MQWTWILQGMLAAAFLFHGTSKLVGARFQRRIFESFGLSDGARLAVGTVEGVGGALLLVPSTAPFAAAALALLLVGIFGAHVWIEKAPHHGIGALLHLGVAALVMWQHWG